MMVMWLRAKRKAVMILPTDDQADDGHDDADDGHDDDQDVDMWLRAKKRAPACSSNCAKGHQRWELSSALMKVMRMRMISAVII